MAHLIFALLLFDVFFGQLVPSNVGTAAFAAGAFLIFLWFFVDPQASRVKLDKVWIFWALLAILALISHLLSAGFETRAVLILVAATFLALLGSSTTAWIIPALRVMLGFASVHVVATILFYIVPSLYTSVVAGRFFTDARMARDYTSALTSHYSYNAMFCVLALLVATAWTISSNQNRIKFFMGLVALAAVFALVLTTKRAHLLVVILAIVIGIASSNIRGRFFKLSFGAMVALFAVFTGAQISPGIAASVDRVTGSLESNDFAEITSGRTQLWDYALDGWAERPLLGHGWATYHYIWPNGTNESIHAHNAIINALYEVGLIGTLLLVVAALVTAMAALKLRRFLAPNSTFSLRLGTNLALMAQAFLLVYAFTSGELLRSDYTFIPYLLTVAIVLALRAEASRNGYHNSFRAVDRATLSA